VTGNPAAAAAKAPSLTVSLEDLPPEGLELSLNIGPKAVAALVAVEGEEPPTFTTALTGTLRLRLFTARLSLEGSFRVGVTLVCDRCLALSTATIAGDIEESLILAADPAAGLPEDEDGSLTVIDGQVDLTEFLAESFWLAWPYRFICRPDCAGLCLTCGADLNQGPCGCLKPEA
jgi:uncharacterized protein